MTEGITMYKYNTHTPKLVYGKVCIVNYSHHLYPNAPSHIVRRMPHGPLLFAIFTHLLLAIIFTHMFAFGGDIIAQTLVDDSFLFLQASHENL